MILYGLIGYPVDHSWSSIYFTEKFHREGITDREYRLFALQDLAGFHDLVNETGNLAGLNVTIPHKVNIIPLLDELDPIAKLIGAVNTIKIYRSSHQYKTKGFNTDASGFLLSLPEDIPISKVLILGTGGASRAVEYALRQKGLETIRVSRNLHQGNIIRYSEVTDDLITQCKVIINATPVGMFPNTNEIPSIPYDAIGQYHFLYDLIYNPTETGFLANGRKHGARIMNGKQMLIHQAETAFKIFENQED